MDKTTDTDCSLATLENGDPEFILREVKSSNTHFEFKIFEVLSCELSGEPLELEDYLSGIIFWDGCSHLDFGEAGYIHLCGKKRWEMHCKLMMEVYDVAKSRIKNYDAGVAE